MKYVYYNVNQYNCIVRSFSKMFEKDCEIILNELNDIKKELNSSSVNDIIVFEKYLELNNYIKNDSYKDIKVSDLKLDNNMYFIFCYNKNNFYHMVPVINNTIYDKSRDSLNLYVISVYEKKIC